MDVLRPHNAGRPFGWVHIAKDGKALCGKDGSRYRLLPETAELEQLTSRTTCSQCMAALLEFKCTVLQAGQARRYADSWYKYKVVDLADEPRERDAVLSFCRTWLKSSYLKEDMPHAFAPQMTGCTQSVDGTWRYNVHCLYTG